MKLLIAGGTGFVGKALVDKLLKHGNKVIILTRDDRKVSKSLKGKVEVLEADISDSASLGKLDSRLQDIDALIHLAASLDYFGDKNKLFLVNVKGTVNLLNLAEKNKIKKFVYISTIEAMGTINDDDVPANETYFCSPVSSYGKSKFEAEKLVRKFAKEKNLNISILRLGNVYGPESPAFIVQIANSILKKDTLLKYLPIYKNRYLHLVYISDAVDGIVIAAQKNNTEETYILAGDEYVTIETLFSLISQELNADINLQIEKNVKCELYLNLRTKFHRFLKKADLITYFMAGQGGRIHRAYSIEKAKTELGYSPKVNLKEGIATTIKWAKEEGIIEAKR